jgi:hypothetical protein
VTLSFRYFILQENTKKRYKNSLSFTISRSIHAFFFNIFTTYKSDCPVVQIVTPKQIKYLNSPIPTKQIF